MSLLAKDSARQGEGTQPSVADIVEDVRRRGDAAVRQWSTRLDGADPARAEAGDGLPVASVLAAADTIRRWHELQVPQTVRLEVRPGVTLERRWVPLGRIGIYVPAGLVSTLLMAAVPAQLAGVENIVVCTPPRGAGLVAATAHLLGLRDVWAVGGPQAIAAMAYGSESIAAVDKIVGPGNSYVNEAKLLVARDVAIDLPAGPSEVLVVADPGVDRRLVELELAAQREHGPDATGDVIYCGDDLDAVLDEIDARAPEHVALLGERAESLARRIRNAGAVFVGASSPVPTGDYATGGNHILPTGRWARSAGGVGVETFMKPVTVQHLTQEGLALVRPVAEELARLENMTAHAAALER